MKEENPRAISIPHVIYAVSIRITRIRIWKYSMKVITWERLEYPVLAIQIPLSYNHMFDTWQSFGRLEKVENHHLEVPC